MKEYDFEAIYNNEVSPLMKQIIEICKEHDMTFSPVLRIKQNT